jgi:diaminopimelate decarboxylase/aspartate kinase
VLRDLGSLGEMPDDAEDGESDGRTWILLPAPPGDEEDPAMMAVVQRRGTTLLTISTLAMWEASGFLARTFRPFDELGISVDLVATSQSAVSITLDRIPGGLEGGPFRALLDRLESLGKVEVVHPCAVVSIVGRRIRTVLHELGPAMAAFREHPVHLVSESSEDLNISFVVDEDAGGPLLVKLHERLFGVQGADSLFGPTWELLQARSTTETAVDHATHARLAKRWWSSRTEDLIALCSDGDARYVYDLATVRRQARSLRDVTRIDRFYFAMKANPHPKILEALAEEGLGFECVSAAEVRRVRDVVGEAVPILFTPNFCPVGEYAQALALGAEVTVDGPHLLRATPDTFAGVELGLRIDPGEGLGHHEKVRTAGAHAKFGHPLDSLDEVAETAASVGARIVGLHAHAGSGILDPGAWATTGDALDQARAHFADIRWLDLGGGLGVDERPGQLPLDLSAVDESLRGLRDRTTGLELRMEPGRYLVAEAGVLLAPVTQVRSKGEVRFVGVATGMNSLIRPALYGAWHAIHNLTRLHEPPEGHAHVVGPICETGDVLGRDRLLPATVPGDVLLVDHAGAYGFAMASRYNLREPAAEIILE